MYDCYQHSNQVSVFFPYSPYSVLSFHLHIFLSQRILLSRNYKFMAMKIVGNFMTPELSATALNYFLFLVYWWNDCCSANKCNLSTIRHLEAEYIIHTESGKKRWPVFWEKHLHILEKSIIARCYKTLQMEVKITPWKVIFQQVTKWFCYAYNLCRIRTQ